MEPRSCFRRISTRRIETMNRALMASVLAASSIFAGQTFAQDTTAAPTPTPVPVACEAVEKCLQRQLAELKKQITELDSRKVCVFLFENDTHEAAYLPQKPPRAGMAVNVPLAWTMRDCLKFGLQLNTESSNYNGRQTLTIVGFMPICFKRDPSPTDTYPATASGGGASWVELDEKSLDARTGTDWTGKTLPEPNCGWEKG